jgi:hypothetical protein
MRKLKSEKKFREKRKRDRELVKQFMENGLSEADAQSYLQMTDPTMSSMIEMAANEAISRKNQQKADSEKEDATEVKVEEESENVQG